MSIDALQEVIGSIQSQLVVEPSEIKRSFVIDQRIAEVARSQFNHNFNINWVRSTCSSLAGGLSTIGFVCSIPALFFVPVLAISSIGVSIILNRLWVSTRNKEGYILQEALSAESEEAIIKKLSQGANIYQKVWYCGGAAASLLSFRKGGQWSVIEWFAKKGYTQVVAYLALLEPSPQKRSQMATEVICASKDLKTAQLLVDLGGSVKGKTHLPFSCKGDLEFLSFFVRNGAVLHAGIDDYTKWESDLEERERLFGGNWYPGNNEGVSENLHPDFRTPLEWLLFINIGPDGRIKSPFDDNPVKYLEAMLIDPTVYRAKSSAEDLYHSLNQAGIRIRRKNAHALFAQLPKT